MQPQHTILGRPILDALFSNSFPHRGCIAQTPLARGRSRPPIVNRVTVTGVILSEALSLRRVEGFLGHSDRLFVAGFFLMVCLVLSELARTALAFLQAAPAKRLHVIK